MAVTTAIPMPHNDEGYYAQKCSLTLSALRGASVGSSKTTSVLEVGIPDEGLRFLCKPMIQSTAQVDYVQVSPLVSVLDQKSDNVSLADLALHAQRVMEFGKSGSSAKLRFTDIKPVLTSETGASEVKLVVVTKDVKVEVSSLELSVALSPLVLQKGACVVFKNTRVGKLIGVDLVYVKDSDVELKPFKLKTYDPTTVTVVTKVCRERFEQARSQNLQKFRGHKKAKQLLRRLLDLKVRARFRGALLCGPSGSGKTSILEEVAAEAGYFLKTVHCPDLLVSEEGQSEMKIKETVEEASMLSREGETVLVLDNIDIVCPRKSALKTHEVRMISTLLACLYRLCKHKSELVVVGTARDIQDVALNVRRFGRLSSEMVIGAPSIEDRIDILQGLLLEDTQLDHDFVKSLASATPGYLAGDLVKLSGKVLEREIQTSESSNNDVISWALREVPPSTLRGGLGVVEVTPIAWDSIIGLDEAKLQLRRAIEWPLSHPELFHRIGLRPSKGCLLYGPPGCGKTRLVRAAASCAKAAFLSVSAASIFSPYVGDSERAISELFHRARSVAPAVLFIDEIDSLVGSREGKGNGVKDRVLSTLLNEMDGIGIKRDSSTTKQQLALEGPSEEDGNRKPINQSSVGHINDDVFVVCATNRPQVLDSALCRPGRLDHLIHIGPPEGNEAKVEMLRHFTRKMPLERGLGLEALAASLPESASGAELENLCKEAAMASLTRGGFDSDVCVTVTDFDQARQKIYSLQ